MITSRNVLSPLPFYKWRQQQNKYWKDATDIYPYINDVDKIPPFQISIPNTVELDFSIELYDGETNTLIRDITIEMQNSGLVQTGQDIATTEDIVFLYNPKEARLSNIMPLGWKYIKFNFNSGMAYYSELFFTVQNIGDFMRLDWFNADNGISYNNGDSYYLGGEVSNDNPIVDNATFINSIWIKSEFLSPSYEFDSTGEERAGIFYREQLISKKLFNLEFVCPEPLCDTIRGIAHFDYIFLLRNGDLYDVSGEFTPTITWKGKNRASVSVQLDTSSVISTFAKGYDFIVRPVLFAGQFRDNNTELPVPGVKAILPILDISMKSNVDGFFSTYILDEQLYRSLGTSIRVEYEIGPDLYYGTVLLPNYEDAVRYGVDISPKFPLRKAGQMVFDFNFANRTVINTAIRSDGVMSAFWVAPNGTESADFTPVMGPNGIAITPPGTGNYSLFLTSTSLITLAGSTTQYPYPYGQRLVSISDWGNQTVEIGTSSFSGESRLISLAPLSNKVVVTGAVGLFSGCSSLKIVPENLFQNKTDLPSLVSLFYDCTSLETVPVGLFRGLSSATSVSQTFYRCSNLTSIPAGLFNDLTGVVNMNNMFMYCTRLQTLPANIFNSLRGTTTAQNVFAQCAGLTNIPANLFAQFTVCNTFQACFQSCESLEAIPVSTFTGCSSAVYFANTFQGCQSLTDIPANLFSSCTSAYSFNNCFQLCNKVTTLPSTLFSNCPDAMYFNATFQYCQALRAIPSGLFNNNTKAVDFTNAFNRCIVNAVIPAGLFNNNTEVTSFSATFAENAITSIPAGLFSNNQKCTNFNGTFNGCKNITSIPSPLFPGNNLNTNFGGVFRGCTSLVNVPVDTFANYPNITTIATVFADCSSLVSIPENIFSNNTLVTNAQQCFSKCTSLSGIPPYIFRNNTLITAFTQTFEYCESLVTIPVQLFATCTNVINFNNTFQFCYGLTSVPADLFINNTAVLNFRGLFWGAVSLQSIPAGLFRNNVNVTDFGDLFRGSGLTSIPESLFNNNPNVTIVQYLISGTKISSVPVGLLANNPLITNIGGFFAGCENLPTSGIPVNIFANQPLVQSFAYLFDGTKQLTTVSPQIFSYANNVTGFYQTFKDSGLVSIPSNLFDNMPNVNSFYGCFEGCTALTGPTPTTGGLELWQRAGQSGYPSSITGTYCFRNCSGLSNYTSIPTTWR